MVKNHLGNKSLKVNKFPLLYSGGGTTRNEMGTGVILLWAVIGFKASTEHNYFVSIKGTGHNIDLTNVCAPTEDTGGKTLDTFYEEHECIYSKEDHQNLRTEKERMVWWRL